MELIQVTPHVHRQDEVDLYLPPESNFIVANTEQIPISDLMYKHTIPVFAKDNEKTISHLEFIETVNFVTRKVFNGEVITHPAIRVSHPIKGRIPSAVSKPAKELLEHEKTLYFERMTFIIEIPSISTEVGDDLLNLTVGGVRAYNLEKLYSRKSEEHFKVFIGFQNKVCTNMCISTDGFKSDIKVRTLAELTQSVYNLIARFSIKKQVEFLEVFPNYQLRESEFAQLVGRARMYQMMPFKSRKDIPGFPLSDSQINLVVKNYYNDHSFSRNDDGSLNLWKLYNLFTSANKMSYIDTFLDKGLGCNQFLAQIYNAVSNNQYNWYLS